MKNTLNNTEQRKDTRLSIPSAIGRLFIFILLIISQFYSALETHVEADKVNILAIVEAEKVNIVAITLLSSIGLL